MGVRFDWAARDPDGYPDGTTGDGGLFSGGRGHGAIAALTPVEKLLFSMYDMDEDGLLSPAEFTTLVHDLRMVHGDIDGARERAWAWGVR